MAKKDFNWKKLVILLAIFIIIAGFIFNWHYMISELIGRFFLLLFALILWLFIFIVEKFFAIFRNKNKTTKKRVDQKSKKLSKANNDFDDNSDSNDNSDSVDFDFFDF